MLAATDSAASALWEMISTSDSPDGCSAMRDAALTRLHKRTQVQQGPSAWTDDHRQGRCRGS